MSIRLSTVTYCAKAITMPRERRSRSLVEQKSREKERIRSRSGTKGPLVRRGEGRAVGVVNGSYAGDDATVSAGEAMNNAGDCPASPGFFSRDVCAQMPAPLVASPNDTVRLEVSGQPYVFRRLPMGFPVSAASALQHLAEQAPPSCGLLHYPDDVVAHCECLQQPADAPIGSPAGEETP